MGFRASRPVISLPPGADVVKDALRAPLRGRLRRSLTTSAPDGTLMAGRDEGTGALQSN